MAKTPDRPFPRLPLLCASLALTAAAATAQQKPLPDDRRAGAATVDVAQCKQWLGTLAGPEFEGRGTGEPGYQKAADYVAAHFKALGLAGKGDDGQFFQQVPWTRAEIESARLVFQRDGETIEVPDERLAGTVSLAADAKGAAVLLNIALPDSGERGGRRRTIPEIDGLDDVDLEGKVVVVVVRAGGDRMALPLARFGVIRGLQGKDAAAVLFATPDDVRGGLRGQTGMARDGGNRAATAWRRPIDVTFGGDDLTKLLAAADLTVDGLEAAPLAIPLPFEAHVDIRVVAEPAPAMNVIAVLPGSDPKLRDEYVVIGSHLDHLGIRGGVVHPGADDDGSGTTGVMAVAQMFAKNEARPKRSVLFVCFSGEEINLTGSDYFVDNCPIPLSAIVAELQMDMIGRDEEEALDGPRNRINRGETAEQNRNTLHLVGTEKLAPQLHQACLAANQRAGFELEYDHEDMFGRSDHANFAQQGVPVAFFFTGLHMDYHQPSDTPDKIHYEKLLRVATYVYDIAFELANRDARPAIDPELWQKFRGSREGRRSPEQPAAPLGNDAPSGR